MANLRDRSPTRYANRSLIGSALVLAAITAPRSSEGASSGDYSLRRPVSQIGVNSSTSFIQRTIVWPSSGTLSFDYRVDSELGWDFLRVMVDGSPTHSFSGLGRTGHVDYPIPAGPHTVRFEYIKDGSLSHGLDLGAVDNILAATAGRTIGRWTFDARRQDLSGWTGGGTGGGLTPTRSDSGRVLRRPSAHSFLGYQPAPTVSTIERTFSWSGSGRHQLYFKYLVDSEQNWDFLRVYVDGILQWQKSGYEAGSKIIDVTAGSHIVRFEYLKDTSVDSGRDLALVDDITAFTDGVGVEGHPFDGYAVDAAPLGWSTGGSGGGWVVESAVPPKANLAATAVGAARPVLDGFIGLDSDEPYSHATVSALPDYGSDRGRTGLLLLRLAEDESALYVALRVHASTPALGGESGELLLLLDDLRTDTLATLGCGVGSAAPRFEDRRIVVTYTSSGSYPITSTSQAKGTCQGWVAVGPGQQDEWPVTAVVSEPETDRGFLHIEVRVELKPGGAAVSEAISSRMIGFGLVRRSLTGEPSREVFPTSPTANISEGDVTSWATLDFGSSDRDVAALAGPMASPRFVQ